MLHPANPPWMMTANVTTINSEPTRDNKGYEMTCATLWRICLWPEVERCSPVPYLQILPKGFK